MKRHAMGSKAGIASQFGGTATNWLNGRDLYTNYQEKDTTYVDGVPGFSEFELG